MAKESESTQIESIQNESTNSLISNETLEICKSYCNKWLLGNFDKRSIILMSHINYERLKIEKDRLQIERDKLEELKGIRRSLDRLASCVKDPSKFGSIHYEKEMG